MPFDLVKELEARAGESFSLHDKHLNQQMVRVLKTIGFDRHYTRAEGPYLFDNKGLRYLGSVDRVRRLRAGSQPSRRSRRR